jgi:PTS system nitrogen regulatory IIA component
MKINQILNSQNTLNNAKADSKKSVLELISKIIAKNLANIPYEQILECLINREKLGSTGIGHGVALPHGRLKDLSQPIAAFVHLKEAIDFQADDNQKVDLFFALLVPEQVENTHLEILAEIAEKFSHKDLRDQLRQAQDDTELYQLVTS